MKKHLQFAILASLWAIPGQAQEQWAGIPVPPALGSAGTVSGSEYIIAQCNLRAPGNFRCADNPNQVREVYIPISAFARSSTLENLETTVAAGLTDLARRQERDLIAARRGIAASVAIGDAPMPSAPGRVTYDINLATFRGEQAAGASFRYRLNGERPTAVSLGFSSAGNSNNAVRVGVSGEF